MIRRLWVIRVQEVFERELWYLSLVQTERLIVADDRFLAEGWHEELKERQWLPLEQIRLLYSNRFKLSVLYNAFKGVIDGQILLLENSDLGVEYLDKLRFLLLKEVDLGELGQLKQVDEAGVLHETTSVVGLDLESGCKHLPLLLLLLPVTVHVAEDDSGVVPPLYFLG